MEDFLREYCDIKEKENRLVWKAKEFIVEHWKEIDDWSDMELRISGNDNKADWYRKEDIFGFGELRVRANPVETVSEVMLDEVDGDFSITINGRDWLWIPNEPVIEIASYINSKIK